MRIGVLGAGAIGGYLGIRLSAAGHPVTLVGRRGFAAARDAVQAIDRAGHVFLPAPDAVLADDPAALREVDLCVVAVKSADTAAAADALAAHLRPDVPVVSLQNGLRNVPLLAARLAQPVHAGMVTYNVLRTGTTFRKSMDGPIHVARGTGPGGERVAAFAAACTAAGEPVDLRDDLAAVQVGKLLLNLNNGLCALAGVPIATFLRSPPLRRAYAASLREALAVVRAAGLPVVAIGTLSPKWLPTLLALPDAVFRVAARRVLSVDPTARSSTLQDLERGRLTEIDFLNGEIAALARAHGTEAPVNAWITEQVHRLERAGCPVPFLSADEIAAGVARARLRVRAAA